MRKLYPLGLVACGLCVAWSDATLPVGPFHNLPNGAIQVLVEPENSRSPASDYQLIEDGRKTAQSNSGVPFRKAMWKAAFVIALDVSKSIRKQDFESVKAGAVSFISGLSDPVAVIAFGDSADVIARFDAPREQTIAAVNQLQISGRTTRLYDALDNSLLLFEGRPAPEREQIIVISDGAEDSHAGPDSIDAVLAKAARRRIPINTIWIPTPAAGARNTLVRASERTLGLYVDARQSTDILKALNAVLARVDGSLIISFQRKTDKSALTKEVAIIDNGSGVASEDIPMQIAASAVEPSWNQKFKSFVEFLGNLKTLYGLLAGTAAATGFYLASFFVVRIYFPERVNIYPLFIRRTFATDSKHVSFNPTVSPSKVNPAENSPPKAPRRTIVEQPGEPGSPPALTLEAVSGPLKGRSLPVQSDRFKIGADKQSDLPLPTDEYVSGSHAHIEADKGAWLLVDDSRNGTFVDGERLERGARFILRPGQLIRFGGSEFRVLMAASKVGRARAGTNS